MTSATGRRGLSPIAGTVCLVPGWDGAIQWEVPWALFFFDKKYILECTARRVPSDHFTRIAPGFLQLFLRLLRVLQPIGVTGSNDIIVQSLGAD